MEVYCEYRCILFVKSWSPMEVYCEYLCFLDKNSCSSVDIYRIFSGSWLARDQLVCFFTPRTTLAILVLQLKLSWLSSGLQKFLDIHCQL